MILFHPFHSCSRKTESDPQIRPNDEVIVLGDRALCVGRALMSGNEMVKSNRGVAVDIRHVKKL